MEKLTIAQKWKQDKFWEYIGPISAPLYLDGIQGEWVAYEEYMEAILIDCVPGEVGNLIVRFPAEATEDNRLHTHPSSDRIVTIIDGTGEFIFYKDKKVQTYPLVPGVRVSMPRGILHTFKSGTLGLLVHSRHNPFVALDDARCLVYPKLAIGK